MGDDDNDGYMHHEGSVVGDIEKEWEGVKEWGVRSVWVRKRTERGGCVSMIIIVTGIVTRQ